MCSIIVWSETECFCAVTVTESDSEWDESVKDGAIDLDAEESEDSEDMHDSSAESDQSEEVRSFYATAERTSSYLLIPLH